MVYGRYLTIISHDGANRTLGYITAVHSRKLPVPRSRTAALLTASDLCNRCVTSKPRFESTVDVLFRIDAETAQKLLFA